MGIAATIAIEIAILLVLLTLGTGIAPSRPETVTLTSFDASEPSTNNAEEETPEETPEENPQEAETPAPQAIERPAPDAVSIPLPPTALPRPSATPAPVTPPVAEPQPSASPSPSPPSRIRAVIRQGANVGPPDTGRPGPPDTQVVGTAPDGSPLYAAQWYREPYDSEIAGYLSTARSPGWGMIACKTAPQWRVEECVVVGESPNGSGIARATLAAAWQFLVRPPRLDGEYQVGAWVRIRMNYSNGRGPGG